MNEQLRPLTRKAWSDLEAVHVVGYFAPQVTQTYVDLGLDPRLSYFASRAAAFGEAGPGLTIATFYVFAPWLVEAALPGAWKIASPAQLVEARRAGMSDALRDVLGEPEVDEALGIAREVCAGLTAPGRPLYAAHAELPWPEDSLLALWHAATLVREHRGDGHVSVLLVHEVDPVEATVLGGLWSGTTRFLQKTRGWSDDDYTAAADRLRDRGWLDADGALTEVGRYERHQIEHDTDRLALEGWAHVGVDATTRLHELVAPLREQVLASDVMPRSLRSAPPRSGARNPHDAMEG
jgi:hypothetical protein